MVSSAYRLRFRETFDLALAVVASAALGAHFLSAQTTQGSQQSLESSFSGTVKPFFEKHCQGCHNTELSTAGVRTNELDASLDERQLKTWEAIRGRLKTATMPPKG